MKEELQANVQSEMNSFKNDIKESMGPDLRNLIKEELALQKLQEAAYDEGESAVEGNKQEDPVKRKKKNKKNYKNIKTK